MKPILEVHQIAKKYRIRHLNGGYLSLRERMLAGLRSRNAHIEDFWALDDVSFEVQPGESIGIIGRNGAGKSTLLKLLSKITRPTKGKIITRGRMASLLEVGTGFHPELTGRENIFLNGSLLGMKRREIELRFDEIIDFSGIEKFVDTPLKHYSSGMQLRLAFSVAAFLEPEILVIDEVLAVGDAEFQKKCLRKMQDVSHSGRTILFVSHNMLAVGNLCTKAIMLTRGKLTAQGRVQEVLKQYQQDIDSIKRSSWNRIDGSEAKAYFNSIEINLLGEQPEHRLLIRFDVVSSKSHAKAFVAFDISNSLGITIMQAIPSNESFIEYSKDRQMMEVEIELPPLIPDNYSVTCWLGPHNSETFDMVSNVVTFEICDSPSPGRIFPHTYDHGSVVPTSTVIRSEVKY